MPPLFLHGVALWSPGLQRQHSPARGGQPAVPREPAGRRAPAHAQGSRSQCQEPGERAASSSGS